MTQSPSLRYGKPTGETLYQIRSTTFEGQPTAKLKRKAERKRERVKETRSCFHYLESIKADKEKSAEKIDGAVATIMALDRAIRSGNDTSESVYDTRGIIK